MSIDRFASLVGLAMCLICVASCRARSSSPPPSVLLITVDTLRADHLGCYGYRLKTSPVIDSLARESVLFERAYAQMPKTNPSLVTLMTGLYPSSHHILYLQLNLPETYRLLPEILRDHGYATCGVVGQYNLSRRTGLAQGFHHYVDDFPSYEPVIRGSGRFDRFSEKRAAELVDAAARWLDMNGSRPFFLWVHFMDPHAAYDPPSPYDTAFAESEYSARTLDVATIHKQAWCPPNRSLAYYLSRYDGEIRYVDDQIGRLLRAVESRVPTSSLLTIFTADHGEYQGDPDGSGAKYFSHGGTLSEAEIRVPLLWRDPRGLAGSRCDSIVELAGVLPTLIEVLGLPKADCDGTSFAPLLAGGARDSTAFSYCYESNSADVQNGRWKLIWRPTSPIDGYYVGNVNFHRLVAPGTMTVFDRSGSPAEAGDPVEIRALKQELFRKLRIPEGRRDRSRFPPAARLDDPETIEHLKSLGYL